MSGVLERQFKLAEHGSTVRTEVLAGLTTFSTMSYIIFVNPLILQEAGMDFGAVMVATILAAVLSMLVMGLYANYPFALAPGMGLNAFFAYTLVLGQGIPWEVALGACFWAGVTFTVLNLLGIRELIIDALPSGLRTALTAGIGLFLAFIGIKNMGLVVGDPVTLVRAGDVATWECLLAALGLIIVTALRARRIPGAILISIFVVSSLAWILGLVEWNGVLASPPNPLPTFLKLDLWGALQPETFNLVVAFCFIAIFDAAGTIAGLVQQGKFCDADGKIPRLRRIFHTDALGTAFGALAGTSPMTTYLESGAGIASGGRTGLTAVVVAFLFAMVLFLAPLASSIPLFATAPALLTIGSQMLSGLHTVDWNDPTEGIPAFVTVLAIPLTFSISTGIALGIILYPLTKALTGKAREVSPVLWVLMSLFILKFIFSPV